MEVITSTGKRLKGKIAEVLARKGRATPVEDYEGVEYPEAVQEKPLEKPVKKPVKKAPKKAKKK